MTGYSPTFEALRDEVDSVLFTFLRSRRSELEDSAVLFDEVERMLRAGGKRIRPCFCYWGYRSAGGPHDPEIVSAAAALELLHTFALIHDDLMDGSVHRRGVPTVHVAQDDSTAVLAGDLALVLADELLMSARFPDTVAAAFEDYSRMRREVIAGQFLDIRSAGSSIDEATARRIAVLKSGRYSVMEPLVVGAALAGAGDEIRAVLMSFGEPLGEAFQMKDDLLGLFGDPETTGKPVDGDIREGKRHLLFAKTSSALDENDKHFFVTRWGAPDLSAEEVERLRSLVDTSGARRDVELLVDELSGRALEVLPGPLDPDAVAALRDLAALVVSRRS